MEKKASLPILLVFVVLLLGCVALGIPILYALLAGYLLFFGYSLKAGFSPREVFAMSFRGIRSAKNILITFLLIGILTALWRASGAIPAIVAYSVKIMEPKVFLLITFLLNALVSFLTGTSFGTAATMGTICMTIGTALALDPLLMGGAILSGIYFGDRSSPVSTSALLVADLTRTDLYTNIKGMMKTAALPFLIAALLYLLLGWLVPAAGGTVPEIERLFAEEFRLGLVTLIPVVLILVLSLAKVKVKLAMLASILAAAAICVFYQKLPALQLLRFALCGFNAESTALSQMIDGGGIRSMLNVGAIVCISSAYSGIFEKTGLLLPIKQGIGKFSTKHAAYPVILGVSVLACSIACNQTLATMLTHQLCGDLEEDANKTALYLENSVIVIAGMIPWCIACNVPLATVGAPIGSVLMAFYLPLIPIFSLIWFRKKKK